MCLHRCFVFKYALHCTVATLAEAALPVDDAFTFARRTGLQMSHGSNPDFIASRKVIEEDLFAFTIRHSAL
jgi:hypothetical protein